MSNDTANPPGQRRVLTKGIKALEDYELDIECPLSEHLDIPYQISIDRKIEIFFPAFIPAVQITTPPNATHCRLIAVTASLDFSYYTSVIKSDESSLIPLTHSMVHPFTLKMELPQPSHHPVFLVLGLAYCNENRYSTHCQAVKIIHIKNANNLSFSSNPNTIP